MRTELVSDALAMALANRDPRGRDLSLGPGLQYTSADFAELARDNGVVLSVGRKGECWDNAVAESFFATIKRELIDTRAWPTRSGLRPGRLRLHRGLVQHASAAQLARLLESRRMRSYPPQRRPSGGIINTTNLSVEPDQAQPLSVPLRPTTPSGPACAGAEVNNRASNDVLEVRSSYSCATERPWRDT